MWKGAVKLLGKRPKQINGFWYSRSGFWYVNVDQDSKVNINTPETRRIIMIQDQTEYYTIPKTYAATKRIVHYWFRNVQQLSSWS